MSDLSTIERELAQRVLSAPMSGNDATAQTVHEYLIMLLATLWREQDDFSSKRPFGNSDWPFDLYRALMEADLITGTFDEWGGIEQVDGAGADRLINLAIQELGHAS